MRFRRFEWHSHINEVSGEYAAARLALNRLRADVVRAPDLLINDRVARDHLRLAHENLEGTYIVRLFAAFEAALRSFDRSRHADPGRLTDSSVMIDAIGGRRGRGIRAELREGAHKVRKARNFWAHESDEDHGKLSLDEARARLQAFLSELPDGWD